MEREEFALDSNSTDLLIVFDSGALVTFATEGLCLPCLYLTHPDVLSLFKFAMFSYWLLQSIPWHQAPPPHTHYQLLDAVLSRYPHGDGHLQCEQGLVLAYPEQWPWVGNHDCRGRCSGEFGCSSGDGGFDAEEEVCRSKRIERRTKS